MLHNFLIDDLIHNLETLNGLLLCDSYISLFQRHRAETTQRKTCNIHKLIHKNIFSLQTLDFLHFSPVVEKEESLGRVHTQTGGHILIVRQCGTKTDKPHILLCQLYIPDGSSNQGLQHRATVIM